MLWFFAEKLVEYGSAMWILYDLWQDPTLGELKNKEFMFIIETEQYDFLHKYGTVRYNQRRI